jgi:hypothetical protein
MGIGNGLSNRSVLTQGLIFDPILLRFEVIGVNVLL